MGDGYSARQINKLVSIIFIISIISIILFLLSVLLVLLFWTAWTSGLVSWGGGGLVWNLFQTIFPSEGFRNNFYNFEEFVFQAEVGGGLCVLIKGNVT